ncbi:hypothetical protein BDK51DRAFT_39351 [Blyttiomyces helicus]|uniref:Uncharacterized protein n=1 Tax=Blyttiomyces helicus TaxID=388810 RepID=A0A4P9WKX1_9FUNG|nr:hypothetical protein BDK51DRAFT_39351 [Blyttiomyces helicus]|eukprot:RKO91830.1 hypothetical protein BDK51DRAFT_39351 [Blyttiomyces helicus]
MSVAKPDASRITPCSFAPPSPLNTQYSSLPLQVLLYFNGLYLPVYWILTIALLIYKAQLLPYPPTAFPLEISGLVALGFLELARLFLGSRGNKTEEPLSVGVFLGLTVASAFGFLYYCIWQTYV